MKTKSVKINIKEISNSKLIEECCKRIKAKKISKDELFAAIVIIMPMFEEY